jgi:hypothetical protein
MRQQDLNYGLIPESAPRTNKLLQRTPSTNSIASVASSIGHSYSLKQRRSPSDRPAREIFCSCDASRLDVELRTLRETAKDILQKSWGDVEALQIQVSEQKQVIDDMKADLENTRALLMTSKKREHDANVSNVKLKAKLSNFRNSLFCSSEENGKLRPHKRYVTFSRHISRNAKDNLTIASSPNINPWVGNASIGERQLTIFSLQMKLATRDKEIKSLEDTILQHIETLQRHPHCWSSQPKLNSTTSTTWAQNIPRSQNGTPTTSLTNAFVDKQSPMNKEDLTIHSLRLKLAARNNTIHSLEETILRNIEILRLYPTERRK